MILKSPRAENSGHAEARAKGCHLSGVPTGRTEEPEERTFYHLNILELDVFLGNTCSVV